MTKYLIIHALNVNGMGTLQVLSSFLNNAKNELHKIEVHISREGFKKGQFDRLNNVTFILYSNSMISRMLNHIAFGIKHFRHEILVFADLPILFKKHVLFLQNKLMFDKEEQTIKSQIMKAIFMVGKVWTKSLFVQSQHMEKIVRKFYNGRIIICRHPSGKQPDRIRREVSGDVILALTSNYRHKHNEILANIRIPAGYKLIITLPPTSGINSADVEYIGHISSDTVQSYFKENCIVLTTSKIESYCLPIVEACEWNLRFVCPKLDYTDEFVSANKFTYRFGCASELTQALGRASISQRAIERQVFSWEPMLNELR